MDMYTQGITITSAANDTTQITAQALIQLLEHYEKRIAELEAEVARLNALLSPGTNILERCYPVR